jgi:hypothetical protein
MANEFRERCTITAIWEAPPPSLERVVHSH